VTYAGNEGTKQFGGAAVFSGNIEMVLVLLTVFVLLLMASTGRFVIQ
jgi:hypothetical protein